MAAAKVLQWFAVLHGAHRGVETALKNGFGIGAGDRMQGINAEPEIAAAHQLLNLSKVKQSFHLGGVISHRVDDLNGHIA